MTPLYFNFPSHHLWLHSPVCVRPGPEVINLSKQQSMKFILLINVEISQQSFSTVFAKTVGLSDKTGKFFKCPANFISLPDIMPNQKNTQTVFWVTWSSKDSLFISWIFWLFSIKFAFFTEFGRTSIQIQQNPIIFVRHFSSLSNFQTFGQLSSNYSEDFAKTVAG